MAFVFAISEVISFSNALLLVRKRWASCSRRRWGLKERRETNLHAFELFACFDDICRQNPVTCLVYGRMMISTCYVMSICHPTPDLFFRNQRVNHFIRKVSLATKYEPFRGFGFYRIHERPKGIPPSRDVVPSYIYGCRGRIRDSISHTRLASRWLPHRNSLFAFLTLFARNMRLLDVLCQTRDFPAK
jgi:hypothetical protein